jgi:CheY-like chemotaxis protein
MTTLMPKGTCKKMLPPSEEKITVLHLEDDKRLSQILKVALRSAEPGIQIVQFEESNPLIDYFIEYGKNIDMFILDIRVPGDYDGIDVARFIRRYPNDAPIILTSAYQRPEREILQELKAEWQPKPWHILETTRTLIHVAKRYRESRYK